MAEEVRHELSEEQIAAFRRQLRPEPSTGKVVAAALLSYGPYLVFFVFSIAMVFRGPFSDFEVEPVGWLFNYLIVGAVWGILLFPRLYARNRLRFLGYKLKWGFKARDYKFWKFDLSELQFFGRFVGIVLAGFLAIYVAAIYAVSWPLAVILEVAFWADAEE